LVGVVLFLACWVVLQAAGLPSTEAALVSAIVAGLAMPSVQTWAAARVDAWLYQPLYDLRSPGEALHSDNLESLGVAVAVRLRELVPVQWAVCVIHDDTTPTDQAARRLLGSDGQLPAWLDAYSTLDQSPTEVSVAPIHRLDTGVVLLLAGPRLDGSRLDGIQCAALQMLARTVGAAFEAGLLRESAEEEAQFRQGLTEMARDLAAAATVTDVLRCFTTHAERLLSAQSASLWHTGPDGEVALLQDQPAELKPSASILRELVAAELPQDHPRDWTVVSADGTNLAFALEAGGPPYVSLDAGTTPIVLASTPSSARAS
jgi:hypothetical protein